MKSRLIIFLLGIFSVIVSGCVSTPDAEVLGELKKWHKVTLIFDGPATDELAEENPFLDYRLDVTFVNGNERFVVPGFYAADGMAAETSATAGNKWMTRFTPNKTGEWSFSVSFKKGNEIAIANQYVDAQSAGFMDGMEGSFQIADTDKTGIDKRAKGRLKNVGDRYLQYE